jgi:hypothetical protein
VVKEDTPIDAVKKEVMFMSGIEPAAGSYATFEKGSLVAALKVFSPLSRPLQDIHARACFLERKGDIFLASMSDGIIYGQIKITATHVSEDFPDSLVLDFESLYKIVSYIDDTVCLVSKKGVFYVNFIGGRIFIPSFTFDSTDHIPAHSASLEKKLKGGEYTDIDVARFSMCLDVSNSFLGSNPYTELDFLFFGHDPQYAWLSNKSMVMRMERGFGLDCSIRKQDLPVLISGLNWAVRNLDDQVQFLGEKKLIMFKSNSLTLVFPRVEEIFPNSYTVHFSKFNKNNFIPLAFEKFFDSLRVLAQGYEASGVIALVVREGQLFLESQTKSNKLSYIQVAEKVVGKVADQTLYFSVGGVMSALKSLRGFKQMNLTLHRESFSLFHEGFDLVVFGTDSLAKSGLNSVTGQVLREV